MILADKLSLTILLYGASPRKRGQKSLPVGFILFLHSCINVLYVNYKCFSTNLCCVFLFTDSGQDLVIKDPVIKERELFSSDVSDTFPVSTLR